jgi:formate dehydrogenase major subunit
VDEVVRVRSYYHFIKALNHYLVKNGLENALFLRDRVTGWEEYKTKLLAEDFSNLVKQSGPDESVIAVIAGEYNKQLNAVILFSEKEISPAASQELFNLAMITGKLGKTASGLIALKEKNNSQGLIDMGLDPHYGTGNRRMTDNAFAGLLKEKWNLTDLPGKRNDLLQLLEKGKIKNLFVFGEDPLGCAVDDNAAKWFKKASFTVVQDYFMTPTAKEADLILPASFPAETGGTFTNTQKVIQEFAPGMTCRIEQNNLDQLTALLKHFGIDGLAIPGYILSEIISLLPHDPVNPGNQDPELQMTVTEHDDPARIFDYGCDAVVRAFEEEFEEALGKGLRAQGRKGDVVTAG